MKPITVTLFSAAVLLVSFVMTDAFVGLCEPRWEFLHSEVSRGIVAVVFLVSYLTSLVSIPFVVRSRGYGWGIALGVVLIVLAMQWRTSLPGMLLATTLVTLLPHASLPRGKIAGRVLVLLLVASTFLTLHEFGFRIYGAPYMVRGSPPSDEDWIRVTSIRHPDGFVLANDSVARITPFAFTEATRPLSADEISKAIFSVPLSELYVRRGKASVEDSTWHVRIGHDLYETGSRFFPPRIYGYYDRALPAHLMSVLGNPHLYRGHDPLVSLEGGFKERILAALNADSVEYIFAILNFETALNDLVVIELGVSKASETSGLEQRACVVRRKRTDEGWLGADVYLIPEPIDFPGMRSASDADWDRLLQERLENLN